MAEKLEDLNLPQAPVHKIIKDALPGKISVGRDVKAAMSRAASMFILYMTAQATEIAAKADRKTLLPKDIFEALEEAEFEDFVEPLKTALKGTSLHLFKFSGLYNEECLLIFIFSLSY